MRISPDINRGPAVAALRTRGILSFRQGTLYSRATSVLGREASDLDELRRGHHNASLVESSVFDLLVQADRASLIALNLADDTRNAVYRIIESSVFALL